jgi:hypothetical protein
VSAVVCGTLGSTFLLEHNAGLSYRKSTASSVNLLLGDVDMILGN